MDAILRRDAINFSASFLSPLPFLMAFSKSSLMANKPAVSSPKEEFFSTNCTQVAEKQRSLYKQLLLSTIWVFMASNFTSNSSFSLSMLSRSFSLVPAATYKWDCASVNNVLIASTSLRSPIVWCPKQASVGADSHFKHQLKQ